MSDSYIIIASWNSSLKNNTATYNQTFSPAIVLDPNESYEISFVTLDTYYSFPNIITGTNDKFTYTKNGNPVTLTFPQGCYEITTINSTLQTLLGDDAGKITISLVIPQLKSSITIANNYTVDLTAKDSIGSLLGFNKRVLNAGTTTSDNIVAINRTNTIYVTCDLISSSYVNGIPTPVIYNFFPNVPPGYKIIEVNLREDTYLPINKSQISSISIGLIDQDNNPIGFQGDTITIRFHLRKKITK